jgi:Fe-S-cluster containining protein
MDSQHDLFEEALPSIETGRPSHRALPLAAPCGFYNRRNLPCHRLAHRPLRCDGQQLHADDRPLLHCELACFIGAEAGSDQPLLAEEAA